jgi:hypothetical protein
MANAWFRMYSEFVTDPKVQMLSEADQRRFIMLLCLRCSNGDVTLHDDEIAFQLRISNEEWLNTKRILIAKNLVDDHGSPTKWDKRQYASDSSAARVARHREKKKKECNVTVTPPDTDTDTDTEINKKTKTKKSKPDSWKKFFDAYPENKKGGTDASAWKAAQREGLEENDFEIMRTDVLARKRASPRWYTTYALGITRYISERYWLTPIVPDTTIASVANPGAPPKTRDLSLEHQLNDRSWASATPVQCEVIRE